MSVLVFGASGRIGQILSKIDGVIAVSRSLADLRRPADCGQIIHDVCPKAVINVAGFSNAVLAERKENLAHCINAAAPAAMAQVCAAQETPLVHLSSPDVFDGKLPMPYIPGDEPAPISALGRTRLAGEQAVGFSGAPYAVLRTNWIFSDDLASQTARHNLQSQQGHLRVPKDCIGAPTPAAEIARALITIAGALVTQPEKSGIYHFTGNQDISLAGFLRLVGQANGKRCKLKELSQEACFGHVLLPNNARLDCRTTMAVFGLERPDWRQAMFKNANTPTNHQTRIFG